MMTTSLKLSLIALLVSATVALVAVSARTEQSQPATGNSAESGPSTILKRSTDSPKTPGNSSSGSSDHAAGTEATTNTISAVATGASPTADSAVRLQTRATVDQVFLSNPVLRRRYQRAAALFGAFCSDWERLLQEREANNLDHLSWHQQGGYETATYTGYGKIESCECKASKEGLPIGKIRYEEMSYYLVGKTIDEAKHALPKLTGKTETLEIFSWEKNKWFY